MGKKKKRDQFVVYSTNPDFSLDQNNEEEMEAIAAEDQDLRVMHDRKQRRGKTVTLITGFQGSENDMKDLCKFLKSQCGSGGSVKDGEIVIQGAFKDKIRDLLVKKGYKRTKTAGG
jgi:translation initiation factor 1